MILRMILDLPSDAAYVPVVRALSNTMMVQLGVAEEDVEDVAVIIGEVCGNVVRHARMDGASTYTVEVDYHADFIDLTVRDRGRGFRRAEIPPPTPGRAGGWGLWLVENLADHVVFEPIAEGGTAVRVRLNIDYRDGASQEQARRMDREAGATCAAHIRTHGG